MQLSPSKMTGRSRWNNGRFTWWSVVIALMMTVLTYLSSPAITVDAFVVRMPFETSAELVDAVDIYLNYVQDEQAMLEVISQRGVMEQWDVSRINDFSHLFSRERNPDAVELVADLSQWDVSSGQNMASMFQGARKLDFDVASWDVSNVEDFSRMFDSATSFQGRGLQEWDVSAGQDFTEMFRGATGFGTNSNENINDLCVWKDQISSTATTSDMFLNSRCPAELQTADSNLNTAPSLRAAVTETNLCQVCLVITEAPSVADSSGSDFENETENKEEEETTSTPESEGTNRPNILFIMTDQQRFDTIRFVQDELRHYNDAFKIDTRNLDKLLKGGAYFRNAYCQCAVCAPARTTLRTGCTIERTGVQHNDLADQYEDGEIFKERVESLESLDHILVEKYGYTSEYYGKWHMPELLYHSKSNPSEPIVQFNDFDFTTDEFEFKNDDSNHKIRRYLKQYEEIGVIKKEQRSVNSTTIVTGRMAQLSGGNPQIDSYTRYPYIPIQLDPRYNSPIGTDLKDGTFDSNARSQSNLMGIYSLSEEEGTPTHFTGDIAVRALHRLKAKSEPWFLTISFHHPHPPFIAPYSEYLSKYWDNKEQLHVPESLNDPMKNSAYSVITDTFPGYADPVKIQEWTAVYYALIEEVDVMIGQILTELDSSADSTLIIFTSDHGEMLGAHKKRDKNNFYEEASRVPLIMNFPGQIEEGVEVDEVVSHLDLFATILDYAGASTDDNSDGKSLRRFIEGTEFSQDYDEDVVFAEWDYRTPTSPGSSTLDRDIDERPSFLVRKGDFKLMMQKLASSREMDMMFNLQDDPFEMDNLLGKNAMSASSSVISKAEHMRCLLLDWMERLDGDKGYFSDPAANYGDGEGDLREIRNRQRWRDIGFWMSDEVLEYGRLTKGNDGDFVRHEYLYIGTREDEVITVKSVNVSGRDAELFTVDESSFTLGHRDCGSIRISLRTKDILSEGSSVDATVTIEVESASSKELLSGRSRESSYDVRLSLSEAVYGEANNGEQNVEGGDVDASEGPTPGSSVSEPSSSNGPSDPEDLLQQSASSSSCIKNALMVSALFFLHTALSVVV